MEGDGFITQEKRSLKISALMLIVATLVTYLVSRFLDGFFGPDVFLKFIVYLAIIVITWQFLVNIYYKNRNRIVDAK